MIRIISIPFEFRNRKYFSLVRVKEMTDRLELSVTIMNGILEQLLYGKHLFVCLSGKLQMDILEEDDEQSRLHYQIAQSLNKYLQSHPILTA